MTKIVIILALILSACSGKPKEEMGASSVQMENENLQEVQELPDTLFIRREINKNFYHAIFIDSTHTSKFFYDLMDFDFGKNDSLIYFSIHNEPTDSLNGLSNINLAEKWLPVHQYEGEYYLYYPSDKGNVGRRMINDSSFVYWGMEGPMRMALINAVSPEKGKYVLEMKNLIKNSNEELTIYQIDAKTGLSVFAFNSELETPHYQLYVPLEGADQYNMIVNFCEEQKQLELEFDKIDYQKLIDEAK